MKRSISIVSVVSVLTSSVPALAQTELDFWHAFAGRLGDLVAEQADTFNASQSDYVVSQIHKGNYTETLNAGIAAFRQANTLIS